MKKIIRLIAIMMVCTLVFSGCRKSADNTTAIETGSGAGTAATGSPSVKTPTTSAPSADGKTATDGIKDSSAVTNSDDTATTGTETTDAPGTAGDDSDTDLFKTSDEAMPYAPDSTLAMFDMKVEGGSTYGDFDSRGYAEGSYAWDTGSIGIATTDGESTGSGWVSDGWIDDSDPVVDPIIDPIDPIDPIVPIDPIDPIIDPEPIYIPPRAGLLTSGEWNDNKHFDFLKNLISNGQNPEDNFSQYFKDWGLMPFSRLVIHAVSDDNVTNLVNADVIVTDTEGNVLNRCKTNNEGIAYAYYNIHGGAAVPALITVNYNGGTYTHDIQASELDNETVIEVVGGLAGATQLALDLMFVTDTTGSMMDELEYLQTELEDVITRVKAQNPNLSLRLSVNFYRDLEDEYVVRSHPFSTDINEELGYLKVEYADGGGDFEEAVEMALEDAVNNHDWREDSIKLMFMILDAPPHNTQEIRTSLSSTLEAATAMGIRVIPIASSGIDKSTEFFLRTFAMVTGGTYTFLTDDSGVGGSHLTPTVGDYEVEQLNEMIIRLINENLKIVVY